MCIDLKSKEFLLFLCIYKLFLTQNSFDPSMMPFHPSHSSFLGVSDRHPSGHPFLVCSSKLLLSPRCTPFILESKEKKKDHGILGMNGLLGMRTVDHGFHTHCDMHRYGT